MEEKTNTGATFLDRARETMTWEARREELNRRFLEIFRHAYRHSKTYEKRFQELGIGLSDVQSLEDLERLPLLRMTDLVEWQKKRWPLGGFETLEPAEFQRIYINSGVIFQPGTEWEREEK